jgi:hypothetical protein
MKLCGKCGATKPTTDFHKSTRRGHQAWCKPCRKAFDAIYHQQHKEERLAQKRVIQAEFLAWYMSLKEDRPCADCNRVFHPRVMQWDHLPGTKKIADLGTLSRRHSKRQVLAEIAKCELVCANCHALRTLARRGA